MGISWDRNKIQWFSDVHYISIRCSQHKLKQTVITRTGIIQKIADIRHNIAKPKFKILEPKTIKINPRMVIK